VAVVGDDPEVLSAQSATHGLPSFVFLLVHVPHHELCCEASLANHLFDCTQALLLDSQSGEAVARPGSSGSEMESPKILDTLRGHLDYSFAVAWHPNGYVLATGNQVRCFLSLPRGQL
jgi:hypothetical protein